MEASLPWILLRQLLARSQHLKLLQRDGAAPVDLLSPWEQEQLERLLAALLSLYARHVTIANSKQWRSRKNPTYENHDRRM